MVEKGRKMRITDNIYLVASGSKWGFGMTHELDCNVYMIDTGEGCILIDAGTGLETYKMDAIIKSHGFQIKDIKAILLSHYHGDHACGAARIQKESGCLIYAPVEEARAIEEGDETATSVSGAKGGLYPADFKYPKCDNGVIGLDDGEELEIGNLKIKVYLVPGHSLCDMVIYTEVDGKNCLFTADSVFIHGQVLIQSLYDVSLYPYSCAMQRLAEIKVDALFPGHGVFCLENGSEHIKLCAEKFKSGLIPAQLYYFT